MREQNIVRQSIVALFCRYCTARALLCTVTSIISGWWYEFGLVPVT